FGLSPALLLALAAALFYLRLDLRFGVAMTALLALTVWGAAQLAAGTTAAWLGWGVGLFVVGWIIQFVGHYYEGRKPAFVDDLSGLIVGPLFVLAELAFLLGLRGDVQREVEERAGPTCIRE
ncbi:Mpo1-like protein, partial [Pseudomonas aeruginosa]